MLNRGAVLVAVLVAALFAVGCSRPNAMEACDGLAAAKVAKNCHMDKPNMISALAKQRYDFDLVHTPGKSGQVLSFEDGEAYDRTLKAFKDAFMLAGPHVYGSRRKLVLVQLNKDAARDDAEAAKEWVDGLLRDPQRRGVTARHG